MYACSECHNCGSIWSPGSEEYDWQQCSACGWTPGDPIDDPDYDETEEDYEEQAKIEILKPNI